MSPDVTQLDGAAATNQEPPSANCHSLPQFPMLPQRAALGTAFLIGLLQAMAEKGMMGIESVALCEDDYGEGTEITDATAANVISGGSGGTSAASADAMVATRMQQAAASCTCTVRVTLSHSLLGPAAPLPLAQPALSSLTSSRDGMMTPVAASERPAAGPPASERCPLRGGDHVPSELLSKLLPFHIAVDSDGRIVQVCQRLASLKCMQASSLPAMHTGS